MRKLHLLLFFASVIILGGCQKDDEEETVKETIIAQFEGLLSGPNQEFIASNGVKENEGDYYYKANFTESQNMLQFDHYYSEGEYGGFGGGFTYTNYTDITTSGYTNLSAITGKGQSGSTYLTVNTSSFTPARITNLQSGTYQFSGAWITNSTYAYLAVKDGDDGFGVVKGPFAAGDYFILTATGYNASGEIGKVDFPLADFRSGKSTIINAWTWIDFTPIASAGYIEFQLTSTDNGDNGMNTPSYFCMDAITLTEK